MDHVDTLGKARDPDLDLCLILPKITLFLPFSLRRVVFRQFQFRFGGCDGDTKVDNVEEMFIILKMLEV